MGEEVNRLKMEGNELKIPKEVFAVIMLCLFISSAVGVAMAPEETLVARNWFTGIIVGLMIATLGYAKVEVPEDFDAVKFLVTVIIGGISGFISAEQGWSYLEAKTWLAATGMSTWIEYFLKMVIRRLRT